jgi:osmotically-inducible protein OsmY
MRKYLPLLLTVVVAAVVLTGPAAAAEKQAEFTDAEVTRAVETALLVDPGVNSHFVDVSTLNGVVTLTGTVQNILASERADNVARTVKGVRAVVNRIEVEKTDRSDRAVQRDIEDALLFDPATDLFEIEVLVTNGVARLTGTVDSWQEKELAGKAAMGVRGVTDVENEISIDVDATRTDMDIREDIERRMHWDAYLDHVMIDVDVSGGEVILTGTVGSVAEKNRAFYDAWVDGVTGVDVSGLEAAEWARDERFRDRKYTHKSDSEIKAAVEAAMLYDPRVNMFDIDVDCDNGLVRLGGVVDNVKARRAAARDARNTVGAWFVDNNIKVRPAQMVPDAEIEENVRDAMLRDPYLEAYEIQVDVSHGEVNLYGMVDSNFEKFRADDVAARIHGVTVVDNNLTVENDVFVTDDPYVDEWDILDFHWYAPPDVTTTKSDWEIKKEIADELFWSPYVDDDDVEISVEDGVATLRGTVDTWSERKAATDNAYEGGAVLVINKMEVEYGPDDEG